MKNKIIISCINMVTIYTYNLLVVKYVNDKSLCDLSLVNKYWMLVTKEQRLLRKAKNQGWIKLIEQRDLEAIKLLHKYKIEGCTTNAMDNASLQGHLEVVKFLHYNRTEGCTTTVMDWASECGHLEVVKFLHNNRTEGCTTNAMDWASGNGHLDVVEYLKSIGAPS